MKICHFVSGLSCAGGSERVMCEFANEMSARGHSITIIGHGSDVTRPFYPLSPRVHLYNLGNVSGEECVPRLINILTALKPDVVLSDHIHNHAIVVKAVGHTYPLILRHHFDHGHLLNDMSDHNLPSLLFCDCLQLLLPNFEVKVNERLPFVKTRVIPNPVSIDAEQVDLSTEKSEYIISMISRLCLGQKQPHVLIDAFAKLAPCYPDWKLRLYGGNPSPDHYAHDLQTQIENLKLTRQIQLMGATADPIAALHQSDIFAFPTKFEGGGLALTEAMSVGLPCLGLKTTSAVNQLIMNGYNGLLANDAGLDLAYKLKMLMDDPQLRQTLGQNARESVKAYAPSIVHDKWEELLIEVAKDFKKSKTISIETRTDTLNRMLSEESNLPDGIRIAVCQFMYGDKPYFELSEKINRAYCKKHGYEYHLFQDAEIRKEARTNEITSHKGDNQMLFMDLTFSKIKSVSRFMETSNCDYVLFLDADAIFYSHDLLIEAELVFRLKNKTFLVALDNIDLKDEARYKHLQNSYEYQNVNSGVFLVRNNGLGKEIMRYWAFEAYEKYKNRNEDELHDQWVLDQDVIPKYKEHIWIEPSWYFLNGKGQYIRHYMSCRDDDEIRVVCERMQMVWDRVNKETVPF